MQLLELRHRGHIRVEDRIRTGKDSGFGRVPSRLFAINAAWLQLTLVGIDLLAWTRTLLLDGEHAVADPKKLRYRLLHVPPASSEPHAEPTCASLNDGPGRATSPPRTPRLHALCPHPSADHIHRTIYKGQRRAPATRRRSSVATL